MAWCLAPKFLASIFGSKRGTLGLGCSEAFLKVWIIHAKKRHKLQSMSNVPLYGWLKSSQSVWLVKRVTCFLIFNWKRKRNNKKHNPNPSSDIVCALHRPAPRGSCRTGGACWLRCIVASSVPSCHEGEQAAMCQLRNSMFTQVTHMPKCILSPQHQGALTGPGPDWTRRVAHWAIWGFLQL